MWASGVRQITWLRWGCIAVLLYLTPFAAAQGPELVVNGGFETPAIAANSSYTGNAGATGLGWVVTQSNIQLRNGITQVPVAHLGKQYIALNGGSPGQLTQNLTTISAATYTVSFWLGIDTSGGPDVKTATVNLFDISGESVLLSDSRGLGNDQYSINGSTQGTAWSRFTFTFQATSARTAVYLTSNTSGSAGLTVDDVSIRQLYTFPPPNLPPLRNPPPPYSPPPSSPPPAPPPVVTDSSLVSFDVSGVVFPPFTSAGTQYAVFLTKGAFSMTIVATPADPRALMIATVPSGSSERIISGTESVPLAAVSSGILTLTVTASDGVTSTAYFFRMFFLQGADSSLQSLSISPGTLSPPFTPTVLSYTASFDSGGIPATLAAVATDSAASITAGTGKLQRGAVNQAVTVLYGGSVLQIRVKSENEVNSTVYSISLQAPQSPPVIPTPVPPASFSKPPPDPGRLPPPVRTNLGPTVLFSSGPRSPTKDSSARFAFSATDATGTTCTDCTFYCALDSAAPGPCVFVNPGTPNPVTHSVDVTSVPEGAHSFQVSAFSPLGYLSPTATFAWVIDNHPPVTSITANVPTNRPTSVQNVVLNLTVRDPIPGGGFAECSGCVSECNMDSGPIFSCFPGQPLTYFLQPGQHTFSGRSLDVAGNQEPNFTQFSFTIDTTPPKAQLTFAPVAVTGSSYARFQFFASIAGSQARCANCTFQCQVDQMKSQPCSQGSSNGAGIEYRNLTNGAHSFRLVTTDPDGVLTSTLTYPWTAVLVGPDVSIAYKPPNLTALPNATFKYTAVSFAPSSVSADPCPGCLFRCSLDGSAPRDCDPRAGAIYTNLYEGVHTFAVSAEDVFGNVGAPTSYTWRVNFSLPLSEVTSGPPAFAAVNVSDAVLTFMGYVENKPCATCTYACQLNDDPFTACDVSTPVKLLGLRQGPQSLTVKVTDTRGVSTLSAPYQWIVDTIPPTATISDAPPPLSSSPTATFRLSATDATGANFTDCLQCTFLCSLDWGPLTRCDNLVTLTDLGTDNDVTNHVFSAVSVDQAGNQALTPAVYKWTVDRRPPVIELISRPPNPTNLADGLVSFSARGNEDSADCAECVALCSLDGQAPFACNAGPDPSLALLPFAALNAGAHAAAVTFTNPLGVSAKYIYSWVIDLVGPEVQIVPPASVLVGRNPFPVTINFSKACYGFSCVSVTSCELVLSGAAVPDPASLRSLGEVGYTLDVASIGDGQIDISIPSGVCLDAAGNPNSAASILVLFEALPPLPVLTAVDLVPVEVPPDGGASGTNGTGVAWAANKSPVPFLVDFGRSVSGFNVSGIVVDGGRAQGLIPAPNGTGSGGIFLAASPGLSPSGTSTALVSLDAPGKTVSASAFYFQIRPSRNGLVTITIPPGICVDAAGVPNSRSNNFAVVFDTEAPHVSLTRSHVDADSLYIVVRFSERVVELSEQAGESHVVYGAFEARQVSTDGCTVTDVSAQADGVSYMVTLVMSDVSGSESEGRVWIAAGAMTDFAGNPNAASETLVVEFGTVSAASTANIARGSTLIAGGLAATTGLSVAAVFPALVAHLRGFPGLPGSRTAHVARGNMVGVIGTVQTFALLRKLGTPQSEAFSRVAGSLAWVNLESQPSQRTDFAPDSAEATGANGTPPAASGRRLLELNGTVIPVPAPAWVPAPAPAPASFQSAVASSSSTSVSGLVFFRVAAALGAAIFARALLALAWRRFMSARLPAPLLFPRVEILVAFACFYAYTQACSALMAGSSAAKVFLGAVLLIVAPCGAIVAILLFLGMQVLPGTRVVLNRDRLPAGKRTWRRFVWTALFGRRCPGRWVEMSRCRHSRFLPLERFGPLFHPFRPPESPPAVSENTVAPSNKVIGSEHEIIASKTMIIASDHEITASDNEVALSRDQIRPSANQIKAPLGSRLARFLPHVARALRDLVRMLRTCHVGALLTKRLIFGALLGSHVAASGSATWQAGGLLVTSLAYLIWLLVGKPYVSRGVQGAETAAALLEVLTLSFALQSARAAAAAEAAPVSARTLGNAMLALQLLAVAGQMGYQCWAAFTELRAGWLWWREGRLNAVNRGSKRVRRSLHRRVLPDCSREEGWKQVYRTEKRKDLGSNGSLVAEELGRTRRRRDRERAADEKRRGGRGSALTSPKSSRKGRLPDEGEVPVGCQESQSGRLMRMPTGRQRDRGEGNLRASALTSPHSSRAGSRSDGGEASGGRPTSQSGRLMRMLTGRKREQKGGSLSGKSGMSPRAEAALDSPVESFSEGTPRGKNEKGGKNRDLNRRLKSVGGLGTGEKKGGSGSEARESVQRGQHRKAKNGKKHAHFGNGKELEGRHNKGEIQEEASRTGEGVGSRSVGHEPATRKGTRASGTAEEGGMRDSIAGKQLIRMKSRRKDSGGSMLSSFVVEEDPDAGAQGFFDAVGQKKLMRLKSRKREMGHATMSTFVVAESDGSESEDADRTAERSTMRVVVRQATVTSYTITRGSL
ncbi:hypothetical protein KFL_002360080 [Klebsormidium nitens]|uniref:Cadherin-like beta-sandwich-like domain-containing protein n=1 Tax=Klebsormidium nitens TaxID=105231 RepID=A0A0U9HK60_KLENI|nr:hypothetical protein KFL_002360080 [Klebsormidium nitens]|eukprot:GAQ85456.1 hypothetical protein KFL_002360080 [Klebsormidium nitens]